ncbi:MAG: GDP-mannose 4,6-dehydratase, partial [Chloroflexota bacterium]
LVTADLSIPVEVADLLAKIKPDRIYHLAGQAFPPLSWTDPWDTLHNNIRSQLNILHTCVQLNMLETRVLAVGSADEYGRLSPDDLPAREDAPFRPDSPYAVSKIAQDFLGQSYFLSHHLPVVRVRPFHHIGPRQNRQFVTPDFAHQIISIERGERPPVVRVGNLQAERDFTDVRDIVRGYAAALEHGQPGEVYNVASGLARSVRSILDGLLAQADRPMAVEVDPTRMRPSDTPRQQGDASKLRAATGWQPVIPFEQSLKDVLDYERQHYK